MDGNLTKKINLSTATVVLAKAIGILFLLNFSTLLYSNSSVQNDAAPDVIRVNSSEYSTPSDASILARRILQEESMGGIVDLENQRILSIEIESILSRIQNKYPKLPELSAREVYASGELIIKLKPELFEIIARILGEGTNEPMTLHTGYVEFDALNVQLGLSAIKLFSTFQTAIFYFSNSVDVPWASVRYSLLESVDYAQPNHTIGDGSDIELQKSQGVWYVVFRHAWGDCPSGCIHKKFYFYEVNDAKVAWIELNQAKNRSEFVKLLERRGWL